MIVKTLRFFTSLEKVSLKKVPLVFPAVIPEPPLEKEYEKFKLSSEATNRELIMAFRQLSFDVHPANNTSVQASTKYMELVEAYDKIVLYRMSQFGVPQPYSEAYYPPSTHTRLIKNFIDENSFWTPHVMENYTVALFIFWAMFGTIHTLCQIYDFSPNEILEA